MSAQHFPTNLRILRREKSLTQQKFSEKIGVSIKRYAKWEEGFCQPDIDILIMIAQSHEITLDELLTKDFSKIRQES